MKTALYPRKESTREKVDWLGTSEIFSPNNFEYRLSSLCNMYLVFLVPSSLSVVHELMSALSLLWEWAEERERHEEW